MTEEPWFYIDPRSLFAFNKTATTDTAAPKQDADDDEDEEDE